MLVGNPFVLCAGASYYRKEGLYKDLFVLTALHFSPYAHCRLGESVPYPPFVRSIRLRL